MHWNILSPIFQIMIFIMFQLDIETQFPVTRGLLSTILVSAKNLQLVEIDWQIKSMLFSSYQNLDCAKIPKNGFNFDSYRHSKSSLSATTGLTPSTNIATDFFCFRNSSDDNHLPFPAIDF